jgi:uncharacterized protein with FMN-binding domain
MTTPDIRSSHWLKSNLAALGSAAVLTVYAAGWARTKAAADLLDEQSDRRLPPRRPAARASIGEVDGAQVARNSATTPPPAVASPAPAVVAPSETTRPPVGAPSPPTVSAPAASKPTTATKAAPSAAPVVVATTPAATTPQPAPAATVSTPAVSAPATSTPTPSAPSAPAQDPNIVPGAPRELATNAQATAPAAKPVDAAAGPVTYKDGLYSGWGTSRHGDIEAYVEIMGGRITSAFISECLTLYSCSWIAMLPPMVIVAQSAETDYISGATHSSNAFYYAVVNALKKAQAR